MGSALLSIAALLLGALGDPGTVPFDGSRVSSADQALRACAETLPDATVDLADPIESDPEVARTVDSWSPVFLGGTRIAPAEGHRVVTSVARRCRTARGPPLA